MGKQRTKDFAYASLKKYDGMMGRCYREKDPSYPLYGGRGIKVCSDWIKDINSFRAWLLAQVETQNLTVEFFVNQSANLQLDRINSNGHYEPKNCRLVSRQANTRNRRISFGKKVISAEGEEIAF